LQSAEGDFAVPVRSNDDCCRSAEVEMLAIPDIGLDDPPAADEFAGRRATS
jgi:hypothetical protein